MQHRRLLLLWAHRAVHRGRSHGTPRAGLARSSQERPCGTRSRDAAPVPEDAAARFDGVGTKFGRRERRGADRRSRGARVRHSYLELVLEAPVLDRLHALVGRVGRDWDRENAAATPRTVSKKQLKRRLTIQPRSRASLHMTYFFAGRALEEMPGEEVRRWAEAVRRCVAEHADATTPPEHALRFASLAAFPPTRQNLLVAVFEPSTALTALYDALCDVAVKEKEAAAEDGDPEYEFPLLRALTQRAKTQRRDQHAPRWIAHVTLGRLAGGGGEDVERLRAWLETRRFEEEAQRATVSATAEMASHPQAVDLADVGVRGLALGGPRPDHVDDDWNFPFPRSPL